LSIIVYLLNKFFMHITIMRGLVNIFLGKAHLRSVVSG